MDNAGNVDSHGDAGHAVVVKIDGIPPTITGARTPAANAFGWNNTPVDVTFGCSDAESGIAGCSGATTLANEGAGQSATGSAIDNAGNTAQATVNDVNIDLTPPALSGSPTTASNAAGWYKGDVTIHWTGSDGRARPRRRRAITGASGSSSTTARRTTSTPGCDRERDLLERFGGALRRPPRRLR